METTGIDRQFDRMEERFRDEKRTQGKEARPMSTEQREGSVDTLTSQVERDTKRRLPMDYLIRFI